MNRMGTALSSRTVQAAEVGHHHVQDEQIEALLSGQGQGGGAPGEPFLGGRSGLPCGQVLHICPQQLGQAQQVLRAGPGVVRLPLAYRLAAHPQLLSHFFLGEPKGLPPFPNPLSQGHGFSRLSPSI